MFLKWKDAIKYYLSRKRSITGGGSGGRGGEGGGGGGIGGGEEEYKAN